MVERVGSEPQSACLRPAAASVSPLDHKASVGFSLRPSLIACSSVFFLVFLSNQLEIDSKTLFLGLSLLRSSLIFPPDDFYYPFYC